MRAREIAQEYPVIELDAYAVDAVRLLAQHRLRGIVVTDVVGRPHAVLSDSQVLRFLVPAYTVNEPTLARVYGEKYAEVGTGLFGCTVRQLLPEQTIEVPVADSDATVVELAALMARLHSPLVAVVEGEYLQGVVTTTHLIELILPAS